MHAQSVRALESVQENSLLLVKYADSRRSCCPRNGRHKFRIFQLVERRNIMVLHVTL